MYSLLCLTLCSFLCFLCVSKTSLSSFKAMTESDLVFANANCCVKGDGFKKTIPQSAHLQFFYPRLQATLASLLTIGLPYSGNPTTSLTAFAAGSLLSNATNAWPLIRRLLCAVTERTVPYVENSDSSDFFRTALRGRKKGD